MKSVLRLVLTIYVAYIALSVLVVMPALNFLAPWAVEKYLGRQLHTEIILFNPFTLSLEVKQAEIPEHDGQRFFGLGRGLVDLSMESLWKPGVVFDAVDIDHLFLHLRRLSSAEYNFSDLLPATGNEAPPAEQPTDAALPAITVQDLDFHAEQIRVTDEARERPFTTHWDGLAAHVDELSTVIEEGHPSRLTLTDEAGGTLNWEGEVSIAGAQSEGRIALSNISLAPPWRFIEPWVVFRVADGRLDANVNYRLSWRDSLVYDLSEGTVELENIELQPKNTDKLPDTRIGLHGLIVSGIAVDSDQQHVTVEAIFLDGPDIEGWSQGSRVSVAETFETRFETDPGEEEPETGDTWTAAVEKIRLTNGRVRWRSEYTDPPALVVSPIEASLTQLRWPLSGENPLHLALTVNDQASLELEGALALASGDGTVNYRLDALPLPWFNPNLPDATKATVTGGAAYVGGQVTLSGFAPVTISSTGDIDEFSARIEDIETNLSSWDRVRWEGLAVDMPGRAVTLNRLYIKNFDGRLHIYEDGTINSQRAWQQEFSDGADGGDSGEETPAVQQSADEGGAGESPWRVDIPAIYITDSELDFMDESLPIRFRTVIGDLNGDILGLSSAPGASAEVELKGAVDGYAPVELKGTAAPFSEPPAIDLTLTFNGVDMALLTPYSGTYAGRTIERGILNLDLRYRLEENHLEGANNILIDRMKLGEPVESEKAVDLPLDLAVALLSDLNGIIDLSVPVSGDVNDPEFGLGSVIFTALVNLITKAVTAPFNLLASLVDSEEDLQRVSFDAGSAALKETGREKLGQLAEALAQRPALTLSIAGRFNPAADRSALQEQLFDEQLLAAGLSPDELQAKGSRWEQVVAEQYAAAFPPQEGDESDPPAPPRQYRRLVESTAVSETDLLDLANERAVAVKQHLVNEGQIAADRAVIEQAGTAEEANTFSGAEMSLGT